MNKITFILIAVLLSGCASITGPISGKKYYCVNAGSCNDVQYIKETGQVYVRDHPSINKEIKDAILSQKIMLGMNREQIMVVMGQPSDVNRTIGDWGVHEQWVYGWDIYRVKYLYFENGILRSIQN